MHKRFKMKIKNVVFFFLISSLFLSNIPLDRIQKKIDKEIKSTFKIENYTIELLSISDSISKS